MKSTPLSRRPPKKLIIAAASYRLSTTRGPAARVPLPSEGNYWTKQLLTERGRLSRWPNHSGSVRPANHAKRGRKDKKHKRHKRIYLSCAFCASCGSFPLFLSPAI